MTLFNSFSLSLGAFLALMAITSSWLLRTSGAPLMAKIIVPTIAVAVACIAPYKVMGMLGYPTFVPYASLPKQAELVAFVPHDEDQRVDLWLRQGSNPPRAYETTLDDAMKSMLREAGARLGQGERVGVRKGPKRKGVSDIETPEAPYVLDNSAFALPSKEDKP